MIHLFAPGVLTVAKYLCIIQKCYLLNAFFVRSINSSLLCVTCLPVEYFKQNVYL